MMRFGRRLAPLAFPAFVRRAAFGLSGGGPKTISARLGPNERLAAVHARWAPCLPFRLAPSNRDVFARGVQAALHGIITAALTEYSRLVAPL